MSKLTFVFRGHEKPPMAMRYGVAVMSVAVAVFMRLAFEQFVGSTAVPYLLQFAAVLVAAGFGGFGPGVVATLLGTIAGNMVFLRPKAFPPPNELIMRFVIEGLVISYLGAMLQRSRRRAQLSEAEARRLEQKILDISDDERRRIGQDLHDGLGQHLTGVAFLSKALQQRLASKSLPETEEATQIVALVSESIGRTRDLARGLSPVRLDEGGLATALKHLAATTSSVFGIECNCQCHDLPEADNLPCATHLYRIAQEAVNNSIRHGQARKIEIGLDRDDHAIRLRIDDNGTGIPANRSKEGMGLQIMTFRARMIGGMLTVSRREIGGTSVSCIVPLQSG